MLAIAALLVLCALMYSWCVNRDSLCCIGSIAMQRMCNCLLSDGHAPPCPASATGEPTGQSTAQPQGSSRPPLPPHLEAELRAMNERMTCLQTSVDDVLWMLSQARLHSIHQPQEFHAQLHTSQFERQLHASRARDRHQTRAPPPKRVSAWAAARGAAPQGAGLHRSAGYFDPVSPKQVLRCGCLCMFRWCRRVRALVCVCMHVGAPRLVPAI